MLHSLIINSIESNKTCRLNGQYRLKHFKR